MLEKNEGTVNYHSLLNFILCLILYLKFVTKNSLTDMLDQTMKALSTASTLAWCVTMPGGGRSGRSACLTQHGLMFLGRRGVGKSQFTRKCALDLILKVNGKFDIKVHE